MNHRQGAAGSATAIRGRTAREYHDADAVLWRVIECDGEFGRCLVFSSRDVVRRVRTYPENWRLMSVPELIRLSWAR
jgi:hypothetical protein